MKWDMNTNYICGKAYDRIWMIRRLKALGATNTELVDVYIKQVRCVLEMAAPVWTPALTKGQITQIERVQKTVCAADQEKVVNPSNLVASRILGWQ